MGIGNLWETLKDAITAYSGLSPTAFFTVLAVAAAFYYVFFQIFGNTAPPPSNTRHFVEPPPPPVQLGEITTQDLSQYNGSDPKKPLLMAIKGKIYDVSQSRMFYGPGGPYELFAGKDASRALAKMSFEEADLTGDITGLGPFELEALQDWEYKFMGKYVEVGTIKDPESTRNTSSDDVTEPTIADTADMSAKKPVEEEAGSLANDSDDKLTHKENESDEKHAEEENGSAKKLVEKGHAKEEGEKGHAKEEGEKGHAKEEAESGKNE